MNYIISFFIGGLYTLSYSPYNLTILAIISLVLFFAILDTDDIKDSVIKSLLFSIGYFSVGTYWLENVINYYSNINYILNIFLVLLFILYLSLFVVIPVYISSYLKINFKLRKNFSFIILIILITFFEILRSQVFTGFSWFNFGQFGLESPFKYFFPVIGVHGLTFSALILSLTIFNILKQKDLKFFIPLLISYVIFYANIYSVNWTSNSEDQIKVSVIQPNTLNKLSYKKNEIIERMKILETMTYETKKYDPDIILWPEAPLSLTYNSLQNNFYKNILSNIEPRINLITGTFYSVDNKIYNSIINISSPYSVYHKKHLVPFGEYLPFKDFLHTLYNSFGLNIFDISEGDTAKSITIKDFFAYPLICYESIFSEESLIKNNDIDFILNVSNDGWFGNSLAPHQHLDALRMRSLENQRYAIRAANSGISRIISPEGNIISLVPFGEKGIINNVIYKKNGTTPLANHGYKILYGIIFIIFLFGSIFYNINTFRHTLDADR